MNKACWHMAVLIPAHNEEALLARCLRSVLRARKALPCDVSCDIVVAVDGCTDGTRAIAEDMLRQMGTAVCTEARAVGTARALAAAIALQRYAGRLDQCWLANTDADCEVPVDWLVSQLAFATQGAEALAGIIDVDSFAEHNSLVPSRFRMTYLLHPDGTHPHVHGANLGVRADVYERAGGWSNLHTAEDHDLWSRIKSTGNKRLSATSLKVLTSGRRHGRAPNGFAEALAAHNEVTA